VIIGVRTRHHLADPPQEREEHVVSDATRAGRQSRPPRATPRVGVRRLLTLPFRGETWRHLLYALLVPLAAGLVLVLQFVTKDARDHGYPGVGPLVLVAGLVAGAAVGPAFERRRLQVFFGEHLAPRRTARFSGAAVFFFVNMLLTTLSFAAAVGWVIVSARNLTYPIWGWQPYPDHAWGGPTPEGAVALHFAAGVAAFFALPWVVMVVTEWQRAAVRRFVAEQRGARTVRP
jgi:hypothetical protein